MTTMPRPPFLIRRLFLILMMLVMPVWSHEGHETDVSATAEQVAGIPGDEQASSETEGQGMDEENSSILAPDSPLYRSIKYAGKFHVLFIHFPIAFLLGAVVAQWFVVLRGRGKSVVRILLWTGAIGAVVAAALGWMYAYDSVYFGDDEKLLFWHRWLGTSTAAVSLFVLLLRQRFTAVPLALALSVCAGLVAVAAHYGASLVYGPDFLLKF